jgi:hypothetical protein
MIMNKKEIIRLYEKINQLSDRVSYLEGYISIYDNVPETESVSPCASVYYSTNRRKLTDIKTLLLELLEYLEYEIKAPKPVKEKFLNKKDKNIKQKEIINE